MGATGSGKTVGLESCTSKIQISKPFRLNGRIITLIDTPGFDDTSRKDRDILKSVAVYLQTTYEQGSKLAGVIYMHRTSDLRMGGTFERNFTMLLELCAENSFKSVFLVSNMWRARMLRYDGTKEGAHGILRHLINQQPATLQIQDELVNKRLDVAHTGAGTEPTRALQFQADRHSEELMNLRAEMEETLKAKGEKTREELREEFEKNHQEITRTRRDAEKLAPEYAEEKAKLDAKIFEMEDTHRKQVEALKAQVEALKEQASRIRNRWKGRKRGIIEEARIRALEEEKRVKTRNEEESQKRLQILQEQAQKEQEAAEMKHIEEERLLQKSTEDEHKKQQEETPRLRKQVEEEDAHKARIAEEALRGSSGSRKPKTRRITRWKFNGHIGRGLKPWPAGSGGSPSSYY
ncbi:hypothetical protein BJ138DRAFT_1105125 [Hygrophoropsis aurantiaca]|uniref:Uncharacterized protein n=1 Tax=Hygrophoropsis aurantiaca TaxID=72124 RepID=A0ACB7ZZJ5_9AGAM|nr:hypothetical protein BJ138DRAFT_1105125 [Hygrophoropsis aurantiaca]